MPTRRQLTLFVPPPEALILEQVRQRYNPAQYALIKSHVTLCREDEIERLEEVLDNLQALRHTPLTLQFGAPVRFSDGQGVYLPAMGGLDDFKALRVKILSGIIASPRTQEPHITLMHPRNSSCTEDIFEEISALTFPQQITFGSICLIEQETGASWRSMACFDLGAEAAS